MARARRLYFRVGVLLVAGAALLVGFVLFLTSSRFGTQDQLYETYLQESVQGLTVGSGVRYRGVAIGRITEIGLVAAEYSQRGLRPQNDSFRLVLVRFAIDMGRLGTTLDHRAAVEMGLRARIAAQGITGVSYLEMDFVNETRLTPPPMVPWTPRYPYIPSIPSTVAQVTNAAEALIGRLNDLDIEALVGGLAGLIGDVRTQLGSGDVAVLLREATTVLRGLGDTSASLNALLEGPALRGLLASGGEVTEELRTAAARLPATLRTLEMTLRSARNVTTDTQADIAPILRDLRATASSLRETAEMLRRAPSQALFGRPPERR